MRINSLKISCAIAALAVAAGSMPAKAEISGDVIRIGVMNDQSGPYSDNCGPGSVAMVKMAVEDAGGTVDGKKVEVVVADDQNKPDIGTAKAKKWVEDEGVDAIVGCSASSIALAIQDIMAAAKKPYLIAGTATSDLTNAKCSPMGTNWAYDTYTLPKGVVTSLLARGLDTWYFITVDYTFGKKWQEDTTRFIEAGGGKVIGSTLHPLNANDFSSQLLQAQASGAKVIAIANSGADMANVIKQAQEFGIKEGGQQLAPLGLQINQVHGIGLAATQGMILTSSGYWDVNDGTRALAKRFGEQFNGRVPNESQLASYSAVSHYLKAVAAAGSDEGDTVMAKMPETPVNDVMLKDVPIREDGVVMRPMKTVKVKAPDESKGPWDYYEVLGEVPAEQAWRPLSESVCPLVKK